MTPELGVILIDLYARAEAALAVDEIDTAAALIESAGAAISADQSSPDPALAGLAHACEDARRAVEVAMGAAHQRLSRVAAAEFRVGSAANLYHQSDHGDARFIDRTS